jgi:hypothetical protein
MTIALTPHAIASSTVYWIRGLFTSGNISFGWDLVMGKNLVPQPAAVITAFLSLIRFFFIWLYFDVYQESAT